MVHAGRIPGLVVMRFLKLEKSGILRWLLQFEGLKERLLADDLFLVKVAMECGVGIFTKTAVKYERRRENFFNKIDFRNLPHVRVDSYLSRGGGGFWLNS
ncbi:protein RETICULATA-RELATED 4, chloroplastic-like [Ziziphus jujuba]|uniref:Protein RETICULATA-RELATED 4, chloroplastic-like n=1 Tax=Ziziphus jujuba TaxID=326968 RepID=A0ABM3ZWE0_ZIZJJ|nr:protein RETICULATA-RELATED 4, chloroplastic-like [Ziziphus jujuba]